MSDWKCGTNENKLGTHFVEAKHPCKDMTNKVYALKKKHWISMNAHCQVQSFGDLNTQVTTKN